MEKKLLNEIRRMQQLAGLKPIDKNFVAIESVRLFCENKISEKEFLDELNKEILQEGALEWIKTNIIDKVQNYINSFLLQAYSLGWTILNKIKSFVSWITGLISKFQKKYPTIFKMIIITIIILIIICVFCACAKAAATGMPIPKNELNAAIGMLDDTKNWSSIDDDNIRLKAIKVLVDLRDGHTTNMNEFGNKVEYVANYALEKTQIIKAKRDAVIDDPTVDNFVKKAYLEIYDELITKGKNIISATYEQSKSASSFSETIKVIDSSGGTRVSNVSGFGAKPPF